MALLIVIMAVFGVLLASRPRTSPSAAGYLALALTALFALAPATRRDTSYPRRSSPTGCCSLVGPLVVYPGVHLGLA
jgi:hypothetical protein